MTNPTPADNGTAGLAEAARRFGDRAGPVPDLTAPLVGALRRERALRRDAERQTRTQPAAAKPDDDGAAGIAEARRRFGTAPDTSTTATSTKETPR